MARAAGNDSHYEFWLNGDPKLGKIRLPSVTTILHAVLGASPFMVKWAYNLGVEGGETPDEFRDRRAEEGHETHAYLEAVAGGTGATASTGYEKAVDRWLREHKPVILGAEQVVYSLEYGYAGTLDLLIGPATIQTTAFVETAPRVVDLKTKKKTIYKAYDSERIQCRAYAIAAQEMGLVTQRPSTAILIAKENSRYTYDERSVSDDLWFAVLETYREMVRNGLVKA